MYRQSAFTLVEIIVTIVVLAIASTALLSVFSSMVRGSADPVIQQQAITVAEAYMEERRQFLVSQGYYIRKLNQAFFAFHGSYATSPASGASEEVNPIGLQLTHLREQTGSLKAFLHTVAPMSSYEHLLRVLQSG